MRLARIGPNTQMYIEHSDGKTYMMEFKGHGKIADLVPRAEAAWKADLLRKKMLNWTVVEITGLGFIEPTL